MSTDFLAGNRIVPVVVIEDPASAGKLGDALLAGGLPVAEVTFRTAGARAALAELATDPRLLVGAGTVTTVAQVDQAVEAGARFMVSPGFSAAVVAYCQQLGIPVVPGVATATELMAALDAGVDLVKFFPAQTLGGLAALRALAAPFPAVRFVPTGGITADLLPDYLAEHSVAAVGGTWMVAPALLAAGDFAEVTARAAAAVAVAAQIGGSARGAA
jgi:2-dehydro-3-deoxyphosphogluconate aldolase/(4S)-4-hydroxy-2-oxoglutarate aldolase